MDEGRTANRIWRTAVISLLQGYAFAKRGDDEFSPVEFSRVFGATLQAVFLEFLDDIEDGREHPLRFFGYLRRYRGQHSETVNVFLLWLTSPNREGTLQEQAEVERQVLHANMEDQPRGNTTGEAAALHPLLCPKCQ